jgi:hypothetical protein
MISMICVWRKVRNGDRTAVRAIPVCAPQPICVEWVLLYSRWYERKVPSLDVELIATSLCAPVSRLMGREDGYS